jgi:hypothetical protein
MFRSPHPYLFIYLLNHLKWNRGSINIISSVFYLCSCATVLWCPSPMPSPTNPRQGPCLPFPPLARSGRHPQTFPLLLFTVEVTVMLRWTTAENITPVICRRPLRAVSPYSFPFLKLLLPSNGVCLSQANVLHPLRQQHNLPDICISITPSFFIQ